MNEHLGAMSFVSHWPVAKTYLVTHQDVDARGAIRDEVVAGWVDDAVSLYLALCAAVPPASPRHFRVLPRAEKLGRPERVVVSAGAKEILPGSFTVGVRLRAILGGEPAMVDTTCTIEPAGGVTEEIRDQLIALEHAARHLN